MKLHIIGLIFFINITLPLKSQVIFTFNPNLPLEQSGEILDLAWLGGINSIQIAKLHLNQDSAEDLIVFDRSTERLLTFTANTEAKRYEYAPHYAEFFPKIRGWFILADYDKDGRKDIFTHSNFGAKVYQNIASPNGNLEWQLVADPIYTQGYSREINLQINVIDIPAIVDIDRDGDLDLITFDFAQGAFLEYHQNLSIENHGNANHLEFERKSKCWGKIYEGLDCGEFSFDFDCQNGNSGGSGHPDKIKHVGSTIQLVDLNGDEILDLLLGDISCEAVYAFINEGSNLNPSFSRFDDNFPSRQPIRLHFPAVFMEDLDFDGKPDLLAASNLFNNSELKADFSQSVLFYKNISNTTVPDFSPMVSGFLQHQMLDLGEDSTPTFIDVDQDGDLDLLVGHKGKTVQGKLQATLHFYENTGSASQPYFTLKNQDFLSLSAQNISHLAPSIQDLNGDNLPDLLLCYQKDNIFKTQIYLQRKETLRISEHAYNLPINKYDQALLQDFDQDGDPDLLVAKRQGNLQYYENIGNLYQAEFTLKENAVAGIQAGSQNRYLRIALGDIDQNGSLDLLTANQRGEIKFYANFKPENQSIGSEAQLFFSPELQTVNLASFGQNIQLSLGDLDQDFYPDLMLGNNGGGLIYLKNTTATQGQLPDLQLSPRENPKVYPNPSQGIVELFDQQSGKYQLLTLPENKILRDGHYKAGKQTLNFSDLPAGMYLLRLLQDNGTNHQYKLVFK